MTRDHYGKCLRCGAYSDGGCFEKCDLGKFELATNFGVCGEVLTVKATLDGVEVHIDLSSRGESSLTSTLGLDYALEIAGAIERAVYKADAISRSGP